MRKPEEVVARINEIGPYEDLLGVIRQDLVLSLPYEVARPFLVDGVTAEDWAGSQENDTKARIVEYLPFAREKAEGHRGISASRSVDHMRAWVWLLGPEEFAAVDWEDYENYGAPILKKVAELVGFEWPEGDGIDRMASGLPCQDHCQDGCGT